METVNESDYLGPAQILDLVPFPDPKNRYSKFDGEVIESAL